MAQKSPEQAKSYQVVKAFKGLNTRPNRTALEDTEFAWIENIQPIGFGNLKVVNNSTTVTLANSSAVAWTSNVSSLFSCNVNNTDYVIAFEADGRAEYFNIATATKGTLANASTFSTSGVRMKQWKNERAIIIDPAFGYSTWDGTSLVNVGSIGTVGITNPGSGYVEAPNVTVSAPNQTNGVQATILASISNSASTIQSITVTNSGSGYTRGATVTIDPPTSPYGVQATAAVGSFVSNTIFNIAVTNPGYGYTTVPNVTITANAGTSATATAVLGSGIVSGLTVTNPGSGYLPTSVTASISTTTINVTAVATGSVVVGQLITANGVTSGTTVTALGTGNGGTGTYTVSVSQNVNSTTMTLSPGVKFQGGSGNNTAAIAAPLTFATGTTGAIVNTGGQGYSSVPTVTFSGGGASRNAVGQAIVYGNAVTSIIVLDPGSGYTSNATITFSGGSPTVAATANAVATLNASTDIASFQGRVWISQGRNVFYSAAGVYNDYVSVSAGNVQITDDTLHSNITGLISANNFLYVFGDDSINVFSDVRVGSTGITSFTNTNVSASTGSTYTDGVFPYFRSLLFINNYGIFALIGATVSKISDALDGLIPLIDFTQPVSGGQVLVNSILCAAFNVYYKDPVNGVRPIQLVFFDKKWFVTSQGTIKHATSVQTSKQIFLYGTANTNLLECYSDNSASISTTVQSALWPMQDTIRDKQALKFAIEATSTGGASFNITVDSETNTSPTYTLSNVLTFYNAAGSVLSWTNAGAATITWISGSGYSLYKSDAQQYGKYLGLTVKSTSPSFTLNTLEMEYELRARF